MMIKHGRMIDEFDIEVIRKPDLAPSYDCAVCEKPFTYQPWSHPREYRAGPICPSCTRHWGYANAIHHFHKSERVKAMKLNALTKVLEWETKNASYHRRTHR